MLTPWKKQKNVASISLLPSLLLPHSLSPGIVLLTGGAVKFDWLSSGFWCCHFSSTHRLQGHQALANEQTLAQGDVLRGEAGGQLAHPHARRTSSTAGRGCALPSTVYESKQDKGIHKKSVFSFSSSLTGLARWHVGEIWLFTSDLHCYPLIYYRNHFNVKAVF